MLSGRTLSLLRMWKLRGTAGSWREGRRENRALGPGPQICSPERVKLREKNEPTELGQRRRRLRSHCFWGCPSRLLLPHPRGGCKVKQGESPEHGSVRTKPGTRERVQMTGFGLKTPSLEPTRHWTWEERRKSGPNLPHWVCFGTPSPFLERGRGRICVCTQRPSPARLVFPSQENQSRASHSSQGSQSVTVFGNKCHTFSH